MKTVVSIVVLCAAMMGSVQGAEPTSNAPSLERAHKVEPLFVRMVPGQKAKVVAILTYDDGSKAKCSYMVVVDVLKQTAGVAMTMAPFPRTEHCSPIK